MTINKTKDVFGIQRDLPLNYIERSADKILLDSLDRSHHVVIYGSSKQGKTSLRKKNIKEEDYILVHCSNKWDITHIHNNILKQAGYELTLSESLTTTGKAKVKATIGWNLFTKAEAEAEGEISKEKETVVKSLDVDIEDVNDIIKALEEIKFSKIIVLEDFHYLKPETQNDFSIALKAFHENSKFTFLIVGVWLEENRLIALNGDLAGRVKSVNADKWENDELKKLIDDGEYLLNISFSNQFKDELIKESLQNVYVVQEVCYHICIENNITETNKGEQLVLDCSHLDKYIDQVVSQHSGRYSKFISTLVEGFQPTELEMYKWILYTIIVAEEEELDNGLRRSVINDLIIQKHPRGVDLNPGNLTQALTSVASLQVRTGITPIIIDYDSTTKKINIVDKGFIIWLHNQNQAEILTDSGLPLK
jgi:glycosyltransferase involved in cell wall biosynthesis